MLAAPIVLCGRLFRHEINENNPKATWKSPEHSGLLGQGFQRDPVASTLTWDNFALLKGLHQTVHLLLCQQQIQVVLKKKGRKRNRHQLNSVCC